MLTYVGLIVSIILFYDISHSGISSTFQHDTIVNLVRYIIHTINNLY